ncbi:hypothetical protein Bca4012_071067 [Brassica carinata]
MIQRDRPTVVSGLSTLSEHKIVKAGAGRNPHGCGTAKNGFVSAEVESSPLPCVVSDQVTDIACGAEFTVWLKEPLYCMVSLIFGLVLTAGLPQYGQLGHGTDNEFNMKDSSVKLAYEAQPRPKAMASLAGETIVKVACGANHSVAVDKNGFVYTWGFGGYGSKAWGHRQHPRRIDVFQRHKVLPPNAIVSAGSANSACGGQLYMWGKIKNNGDDWMYPKPMMDLSGWNLRWMDSGSMHHFVGADSSCISWGHAQYGELGYGPNDPLQRLKRWIYSGNACNGCGMRFIPFYGRTALRIANRYSCHTAKRSASKKRKASKASSDSEQDGDEENNDKEKEAKGSDSDYSDDDGEEEANGKKQSTRSRGRGRGGRGRGGRTGNRKASPVKTSGRRGRPRKS